MCNLILSLTSIEPSIKKDRDDEQALHPKLCVFINNVSKQPLSKKVVPKFDEAK